MKKMFVPVVLITLIVSGGAFYGGMKYGQSKSPLTFRGMMNGANGFPGGGGRNGFRGNGGMGGPQGAGAGLVMGEVLSKDDTSITVKLRDGGSKIIFFSNSTQVMKTVEASAKDLVAGQQITATGSSNSDGSTNAQSIQIRPALPVTGTSQPGTTTKPVYDK